MVKPRLYVDTSVLSAYFDGGAPERQELTREFWKGRLHAFEPVISEIVLLEIQDTPDPVRRAAMDGLVSDLEVLPFDDEARALAQEYVNHGLFTEKHRFDANHVAIATVNNIRYFTSWDFRHLVKVTIRREVNLINLVSGYDDLEIVAPAEL